MLDHDRHIPYYIQIKAYLRELAASKEPHDSMPSEPQLAAQFGVSRGTVKQAIMDLVNEGVLYRKQGRGTFVCEPRITRFFDRLPSFTDDIRRSGKGPQTHILSFKQVSPPLNLKHLFAMGDGETLIKIKRIVSTEDSPVVVLTSFLNPHIYPRLSASDIKESLYTALKTHYGIVPVKAQDTYSIVDVSPQTAGLLKCSKDACVFFSQRIAYLENDEPAEYVESFIRSDRFKLNIFIGMKGDGDPLERDDGGNALYCNVSYRNVLL